MIENKLGVQPELREEISDINDAVTAIEALTDTLTLPIPVIADLAGGASLADTIAKVNALLAALRTAGILATV